MENGYAKVPIERYDELVKKEKMVNEAMERIKKEKFKGMNEQEIEIWTSLREEWTKWM